MLSRGNCFATPVRPPRLTQRSNTWFAGQIESEYKKPHFIIEAKVRSDRAPQRLVRRDPPRSPDASL
jgi:hypothetical protein